MIGEPDAGKPPVRFDEGVQETYGNATRLRPTLRPFPPWSKKIFQRADIRAARADVRALNRLTSTTRKPGPLCYLASAAAAAGHCRPAASRTYAGITARKRS